MAEFLTTKGIGSEIERIIRTAQNFVYLLSFNVNIRQEYLDRIVTATNRGVKVKLVYGVDRIDEASFQSLSKLNNVQILQRKGLHAKIYINENELVITSMNLSDYSENNNVEIGIRILKNQNAKVYGEALQEVLEVIESADITRPMMPISVAGKNRNIVKLKGKTKSSNKGYCIRCKSKIKFDREKSLCTSCYKVWSGWEDEYYGEEYCHNCGKKTYGDTCYAEPLCNKCYYG